MCTARMFLVAVAALTAVSAPGAWAAPGELTQLPGLDGCVTDTGTNGQCADGRALSRPKEMVISPDGKHAYVVSKNSNAVAAFSRDPMSGALSQLPGTAGCVSETGSNGECTDGRVLQGARSIAISPDGKHVYVGSEYANAVAAFTRDSATGELTQPSGAAGCIHNGAATTTCAAGKGLFGPHDVVMAPDGTTVYVASAGTNTVSSLGRDAATGALSQLSCINDSGTADCLDGKGLLGAHGLAVSPDGKNVYVAATNDTVAILQRAGNGDPVPPGHLYQPLEQWSCVSDTGSNGACIDGTALDAPRSVTLSVDGKFVYVSSTTSASTAALSAFARDAADAGKLTQLPGLDACISETGNNGLCTDAHGFNSPWAAAVTPDGQNVYVAITLGAVGLLSRDPVGGALSQLPSTSGCISKDTFGGLCQLGRGVNVHQGSITISADGKQVYAVAEYSDGVAVFSREIDTTPPETVITSGPSDEVPTADNTPTFGFSSPTDANATFECRLDGGGWSGCSSPATLAPVSDGQHLFEVRAIDANGIADPSPAQRAFSIDTVPPDTTITAGPGTHTVDTTPTFEFVSNEPGSTFECRMDAGPWTGCASPHTSAPLTRGPHAFQVRAIDPAGNVDPTPAFYRFTVITFSLRDVPIVPLPFPP